MSVDGIDFNFFDLPMSKVQCKIKLTDDTDDALLRGSLGFNSDRWIKNALVPFVDSFPLTGDKLDLAMSATSKHVAYQYKQRNNNHEGAKEILASAEKDLADLIKALKALPTTRTKIVIASQSYDTEDDILFSQRII